MLKLAFWGACDTVTGSCYQVTTDEVRILVDCGLFQGFDDHRERNERSFPFAPGTIDYLILTHAHIDHSGLIPKLVKEGFSGKIVTTKATADLSQVMLLDSAHLQALEAEWESRKKKRAGKHEAEPLYTVEDAQRSLRYFHGVDYGEEVALGSHVRLRLYDAGHIMGSAMAELVVTESGQQTRLVFSGDLGARNHPIIADPTLLPAADFVVMESTYGDRVHERKGERSDLLRDVLLQAAAEQERVIIPSFAVGRTQDILYEINKLFEAGEIPALPVYIDSPLAISTTEIFARHAECFDQDTAAMLKAGKSPFAYPQLHYTRTMEESKALNDLQGAAVIISASGMCEAGRIKHHLKHNLWRPGAHILFVGYQAEGTLGRRIKDGADHVTILGEEIAVQAHVHAIEGFSAHGDRDDLRYWIGGFKQKPRRVFVTHGEAESRQAWASTLQTEFGISAVVPDLGQEFDLLAAEQPVVSQPLARTPQEGDLAVVDALWQQARSTLARHLNAKGRKLPREASRYVNKLAALLQEIQAKLGR